MGDMLEIPPIPERRAPMDENTVVVAKTMAQLQLLVTIGEIKTQATPDVPQLTLEGNYA